MWCPHHIPAIQPTRRPTRPLPPIFFFLSFSLRFFPTTTLILVLLWHRRNTTTTSPPSPVAAGRLALVHDEGVPHSRVHVADGYVCRSHVHVVAAAGRTRVPLLAQGNGRCPASTWASASAIEGGTALMRSARMLILHANACEGKG